MIKIENANIKNRDVYYDHDNEDPKDWALMLAQSILSANEGIAKYLQAHDVYED